MAFEVVWVKDIRKDFRKIEEDIFLKIKSKIELIAKSKNPYLLTERIRNYPPNARKIRMGIYRLLVDIRLGLQVIYCLAFLHRKDAYKTHKLAQIFKTSDYL